MTVPTNLRRRSRAGLRACFAAGVVLLLAGCASRPINPPMVHADPSRGYRYETRPAPERDKENLVILAFSGGGTRAAAFSYGVLEFLRRTEVVGPQGRKGRLIDQVDVITGVSGGSFTALAYGLYGDRLFDDYVQRFLKRDVQGDLIARAFKPDYWVDLGSTGWGRSELAAQLYDEILFKGATFGDLVRGKGPLVLASATDISTGARLVFQQSVFDVMCSDLSAVSLSRAAAASSAVPVVLSPVTLNNYGGTCGYRLPPWARTFDGEVAPPRPAARAIRSIDSMAGLGDGAERPFVHLVDGGVSDNVGMRGVLDALELLEALHEAGLPTPLDHVRRVVVFIVNSLSTPPTHWDRSARPPGTVEILLKASGVPIDHNSYEAVELLRDTAARWQTMRRIRESAAMAANKDPAIAQLMRVPDAEIYAIDVSFAALKDRGERAYLNSQPTSFHLPDEAVDRLRAAASTLILDSPEFARLLKDAGSALVPHPP
ncbi:patatin-like phospholipase family protein [Variovorax saccharolyticus]|uniref:patatin-like phospholipase family protein n=1 Tax=Variovorax saccharolyticus TaxID=3053516 RepID=UPI0025775971|nr:MULTISPECIES: patatin-like phospholipase family protein [unclassified Variovorax]MDM0022455.1 patatin-like phospholipase family protein [Variovorax sp. J22R187]MDM0028219.1 patatin-like phospholipase family protein [Variovorax sp. J31P216]